MDRTGVQDWIAGYERAWRTPGTEPLSALFTPDASYLPGPYREPVVGLPDISLMWEAEREGPDEEFEMTSGIVAVDGNVGVARIEVRYGTGEEFRDLWIMTFAGDGPCAAFEEWPFSPPS
ncbi:nuclear transport factor 2 family protein [Plantactinospora mayteni]|uniref:nuclear transport factor 2 family protein n=1 Tax=Plantactinospora mayteni TaxID=566021 RepID=UPI0019436DA1|nr:nuclear transport factor 2 family protein [Plantactinospora mayteni]